MENTNPKEILENIISVMEKTHVDDWEIDKLVVVLNYINELENKIDKSIEYIEQYRHWLDAEKSVCDSSVDGYALLDILRGEDNE